MKSKYGYDEDGKLKLHHKSTATISKLQLELALQKLGHANFDDSVLNKKQQVFYRFSLEFDRKNKGLKAVCDVLSIDVDELITEALNYVDD